MRQFSDFLNIEFSSLRYQCSLLPKDQPLLCSASVKTSINSVNTNCVKHQQIDKVYKFEFSILCRDFYLGKGKSSSETSLFVFIAMKTTRDNFPIKCVSLPPLIY